MNLKIKRQNNKEFDDEVILSDADFAVYHILRDLTRAIVRLTNVLEVRK